MNKNLVRVNGQPIVSVLNSIMTEITAMRSQFFSPTDGQKCQQGKRDQSLIHF